MERRIKHSTTTNKGFQKPRNPSSSSSSWRPLTSTNFPSKPKKTEDDNDKEDEPAVAASETSSSDSVIVGTCADMCPARERAQRERLRDLSMFERLNGDPRKTSPDLAVKKFCRTISTMDVKPSDLRPLQVLQDTLTYLLNLLDCSAHPFELVHEFIFDRTRSIRQDLSMQNIVNDQAVHMYEEMVKFHIISHHKLPRCSASQNISSVRHLNMEQLWKSLTSLYNLYEANRKSISNNKKAAEFYSFYVLLHLGSKSYPKGESLSLWFRGLTTSIIKSKEMSFARRILRFYRTCNYKCFFSTTAADASYLQYCLMEPFIDEVRVRAISCINYGSYKLHPYPLVHLSEILMMKVSDMESLCNACGLTTSTDEAGNMLLPTKQAGFSQPKRGFEHYNFLGLERLQR